MASKKNYKRAKANARKSGPKLTSTVTVPASSASTTSTTSGTTKRTTSSRRSVRAARAKGKKWGNRTAGNPYISGADLVTYSKTGRASYSGSPTGA